MYLHKFPLFEIPPCCIGVCKNRMIYTSLLREDVPHRKGAGGCEIYTWLNFCTR